MDWGVMSIYIGYKLLEIISKLTNLCSISWSTLHIYFINLIKFTEGHFDLLFMRWVSYSRQKDFPLDFCLNSSYVPRTMELDTLVCIINAPMTQHSFIFTSTLSYQKTYTRTRKSRSLSLPHIPTLCSLTLCSPITVAEIAISRQLPQIGFLNWWQTQRSAHCGAQFVLELQLRPASLPPYNYAERMKCT